MVNNKKIGPGFKPSALGPIPDSWNVSDLGELIDMLTGYAFPSEKFAEDGIRLMRGSNVKRNEIDWSPEITRYWSVTDVLLDRYALQENDIVIALDGALIGSSFAKVSKKDLPSFLVQRVARLRGKKIDQDYLHILFSDNRFIKYVDSVKTHTAIPHISPADIKNYLVPSPPAKEQIEIARLIKLWDKSISITTQLIGEKVKRKKWLMQQLLGGRKRLKGFKGEWKSVSMSNLFERVVRKNIKRNTNVVTISAQRGFVKQTDFFNKNIASEITDNYFLVTKGEFCYNKSYSNGYPWGATKRLNDFEEAVVTTLYICFTIKDQKKYSPDFFEHFFNANLLDKGLMKIAHEGGRAHGLLNVTPADFFNLRITLPEYSEQISISQIISTSEKEIKVLKMKVEKLKEQKKGLMQQLLTGKKRLKIKK